MAKDKSGNVMPNFSEPNTLSVPDFSDFEAPKWGIKPAELVEVLQKEWTPPDTCYLLREWIAEDKKLDIDTMLERLFRLHYSYDGTIRKAYRLLAGGDERIAMNAVKKIYSKVASEIAAAPPALGIVKVA